MPPPQRPDEQESGQPIERASLRELRVRRASPTPDARDAYDELRVHILQKLEKLTGSNPSGPDQYKSRAAIQASLDALLAQEKIILKQNEKRRLTNDVAAELLQAVPSKTIDSAEDTVIVLRSMDEFVEAQMLTSKTASYLQKAVTEKANILISGQDGAGKTSLLRALCAYIPAGEQIITIEARAELQLANTHVIGLETEETDISQIPKISLEALLMTSMRMRPDRLILGSLEGAEAYTWLQAINGGLRGSMTTCSGKNPLHALARIEAMALRANPTALTSIREEIGSAIDLIVHLEREVQNDIRVASISELHGYQNNQFVTIDKC